MLILLYDRAKVIYNKASMWMYSNVRSYATDHCIFKQD